MAQISKVIRLPAPGGAVIETTFKKIGNMGESSFQRVGRAAAAATEPVSKLRDRLLPLHRSCAAEPLQISHSV
jgi:hypothetical protein